MTTFYKEILPEVLILILNYNQKNDTLACIESLGKLSYSNFRVLLIDNNSQDASAEAVLQKFPKVTVIKSKINLGCAGGRNVGIEYFLKQTKADYLFFLDNDTVVDRGLLNELVHKGESDSDIGVVSLKAYYFNQPNKFWFVGGAKINWREGNFYNSGQGEVDRGQFDQDKEIDSVPGGFTFIKRRVLEIVGKIDERYF
ncbi:MAG: glycosyltransferase family 2 protein, partial [Candidatus Omnitrophica bacterium]|nr:glycosyltransferase family 2 protein [Candidatus Omnitrophota bacterium]